MNAAPPLPVIIVGGGLAGLACATDLHKAGLPVLLIEAEQRLGGRIGSRTIDGHVCDLGFQVLLDDYPQVRSRLDLKALELGRFVPGAILCHGSQRRRMADPLRVPSAWWSSLGGPGSLGDKWRLLRLARQQRRSTIDEALAADNQSTREWLQAYGLSDAIIDGFFAPWFGGILCDRSLSASSRLFLAYYGCLTRGHACLPRGGMQAIPDQLATALPPSSIRLGQRVTALEGDQVILANGERLRGQAVVLASDGPSTQRLLGAPAPTPGLGLRSLYFSGEATPKLARSGAWIVLDGSGSGPINHCAVPSAVAAGYAPPGRQLIVATALNEHCAHPALEAAARSQLSAWFGPEVATWRLLCDQSIPYAQPRQLAEDLVCVRRPLRLGDTLWQCGDHRDQASINGALASGERCATEILAAGLVPRQ